MSGSSGSRQTTRLLEFLQLIEDICNAKFYKINCYYSTWKLLFSYKKILKYFVEGLSNHESLMSMIDNDAHKNISTSLPDHQLLIFDDLLCEIGLRTDNLIQKLFTTYSNHKK